ncbi:unnamed protein product [Acanthoscelides obtectus]|uniref:Uncharacterized protein n=1 Tax=Acanthoscelides obtectus TaxID=200917 RepID=A0A9P0KZP3_ACAOB|nr:unnamed protein product [Acanthoscelides obtectus]CAK1637881.1 hypothetical protein AOBTE_LOCUS10256 [Acanthoscelides obtectus]
MCVRHIYLILLFYNIGKTDSRLNEIKCPNYCKCDVFESMRRATCQNKMLYSIEVDIPPQAEIIDLSHNQISELGGNIFLILDLSKCAIESLHPDVLQYVPNVQVLDISENFLIHLTTDVIQPISHLNTLRTKRNPFRCKDLEFARLRNYTSKHQIAYDDPCRRIGRRREMERFQRMMALEPQVAEKNVWLYEEDDEPVERNNHTEVIILCNETRKLFEGNFFEEFVIEVVTLSPLLSLLVVLIFGITLGIALGCICQVGGSQSSKNMTTDKEESSDDDISLPNGYVPSVSWSYRRQSNLDTLKSRQTDSEILCAMLPDGRFSRQHSTTDTCKSTTKSTASRKLWREDRPTPDRTLEVVPYTSNHLDSKPLSNITEVSSFGSTRTTVVSDLEAAPPGEDEPDGGTKSPRKVSKSYSFTSSYSGSIVEVVPFAHIRHGSTNTRSSMQPSICGSTSAEPDAPIYDQVHSSTTCGLSRQSSSRSSRLDVVPYGLQHPDNRFLRQISNASTFKPLSRSCSARKASETSDTSNLLANEFCIYDSTPVLVRKDLGDI